MTDSSRPPHPAFRRFAWSLVAYNLVVVAWGAFVRATGSGAGCGSHWPLCNGEVVPRAPAVETLIEYSHRLTSGLDGLLVLGLFLAAFRLFPRRHRVRLGAAASLVFLIAEALVGAGLVKLGLVADDASAARALVMAFHLVNTFLLLASLTVTAVWAGRVGRPRWPGRGTLGWLLAGGAAAWLLVGISGAVTALGDTLFPAREFAWADLSATSHFLVRLRVFHPAIAVVLGGCAVLATLAVGRRRPAVRRTVSVLTALWFVQLAAGFVNVMLRAPVWMQLVHLLLADLLWIAFVVIAAGALAHGAPQVLPGPQTVPATAGRVTR